MTILDELIRTRDETLDWFRVDEDDLEKRYAAEKWPVRWILHHLCDAETVLFERIRRVISEPRPVIWAFDQDAWARRLDYDRRPLSLSRDLFAATRAGVLDAAERHYLSDGHREFVHSETGLRTLRDELDKVAAHNEGHLRQIRLAVGRAASIEQISPGRTAR
jgi:hypothetical protein